MAGVQRLRLVIEGLWAGYSRRPVIKGISASIEGPAIVGIVGPNGSGKTTLLRCLAGLLKPLRGRITVNGIDLLSLSEKARARIVSYVPQRDPVCGLRLIEYVSMGLLPHGLYGSRESEERALECLKMLGIDHLAERRLNEVSGGELRLASIARAIAQNTPIILLDEPLESLDPANRTRVANIIKKLRDEGRTLILTIHSVTEALPLCDLVMGLKSGELVFLKDSKSVTENDLKAVYGVKTRIIEIDGKRIAIPLT